MKYLEFDEEMEYHAQAVSTSLDHIDGKDGYVRVQLTE